MKITMIKEFDKEHRKIFQPEPNLTLLIETLADF